MPEGLNAGVGFCLYFEAWIKGLESYDPGYNPTHLLLQWIGHAGTS